MTSTRAGRVAMSTRSPEISHPTTVPSAGFLDQAYRALTQLARVFP